MQRIFNFWPAVLFLGILAPVNVPGDSVPGKSAEAGSYLQAGGSASAHDTNVDYEPEAEQQLLILANQSRQQAGAPPLTMDAGLSEAARIHARLMRKKAALSHQFEGEAELPDRLAATTKLQLDQEGENVAFDSDVAHGHEHFMNSPPHRANLLNPAFNVVGMGVVRGGDHFYIVQDFGHALTSLSPAEVKDRIAAAVNQIRHQANLPDLPHHDLPEADDAACSMAQADKVSAPAVAKLAQRFTVISFTVLHPETLPGGADRAINPPSRKSFSVGACFRRTPTYPTGIYWIVLSLD